MNRLWRRLGVFLAAVTVAVPVESAAPAFASTVDEVSWASCQARSTGSMSFGATILDWLDGTQLTYSASVARDCFTNTSLEIVELTPQLNDKPQRYLLAWRAFGPYDGTMPVTPLRTLRWSLRLVNPLGTKDLATVDVTVNQPQGALQLPAGVTDVTIASSSVAERRRFVHAVKTPNLPVRIPGNLDLDLSGLNEVVLAPGSRSSATGAKTGPGRGCSPRRFRSPCSTSRRTRRTRASASAGFASTAASIRIRSMTWETRTTTASGWRSRTSRSTTTRSTCGVVPVCRSSTGTINPV